MKSILEDHYFCDLQSDVVDFYQMDKAYSQWEISEIHGNSGRKND